MLKEKKITLLYNGEEITFQCKSDQNIFKEISNKINKDLENMSFLYNGGIMEEDFNLEEIKKNEIKIVIIDFDLEREKIKTLKQSREIICPICKELCVINFKNYKISLKNCINKHCFPNLIINEIYDFQKIDEEEILCKKCGNNKLEAYENKFYICCNCNINLCPLCKNSHDKKHTIIKYEDKNKICNKHGERYIIYCKDNNENKCDLCDMKNNNIFFYKVFKNLSKLNNLNELQIKINNLKNELKNISKNNELTLVINNFEKFYNTGINLINYNMKYNNYYSLVNVKNLFEYNENIIKDIDIIIKEKKEENRLKNIKEIYDKMIINNIITIKYKIENLNLEGKKLQLFGKIFVEKNKDKFQIIIDGKNQELTQYLNFEELEIEDKLLEIKLKQIKNTNDISYMFSGCKNLREINDILNWKTDNIINMSGLFCKCDSLEELPDISSWNTINVKFMSNIFEQCSSLKSLPDISKWNIENVTDISYMFSGLSLESLPDISKWNTKNITNMSGIFNDCSSLKSLPDISKWNTKNITNMS